MKDLFSALKITCLCIIIFSVMYPLSIFAVAQLSPNKGKGEIVESGGRIIGFKNIGQSFTDDKYFHGRPSAVNYNAAGSGGSNKAPSNKEYLFLVSERIDTFLTHNPSITKSEIPSDLVTASGSGLDPHISVQAAKVQVKRIANVRGFNEEILYHLINQHKQKRFCGILGTEQVNVLELNLALDKIK